MCPHVEGAKKLVVPEGEKPIGKSVNIGEKPNSASAVEKGESKHA